MLRKTHCSPYGGWREVVTGHGHCNKTPSEGGGGGGKDNFIVTNKPEVK